MRLQLADSGTHTALRTLCNPSTGHVVTLSGPKRQAKKAVKRQIKSQKQQARVMKKTAKTVKKSQKAVRKINKATGKTTIQKVRQTAKIDAIKQRAATGSNQFDPSASDVSAPITGDISGAQPMVSPQMYTQPEQSYVQTNSYDEDDYDDEGDPYEEDYEDVEYEDMTEEPALYDDDRPPLSAGMIGTAFNGITNLIKKKKENSDTVKRASDIITKAKNSKVGKITTGVQKDIVAMNQLKLDNQALLAEIKNLQNQRIAYSIGSGLVGTGLGYLLKKSSK